MSNVTEMALNCGITATSLCARSSLVKIVDLRHRLRQLPPLAKLRPWSAKATTFYFPATTFFVLGGYTLSAALNGKEVKQGTWLSFYNSRYQNLFPMYLLSLLFGLINVLVVCRPSTFSSEFSWQPHPDTLMLSSGKLAQCQTGPVEMPYGAWLFSTIVVFSLGLQTWFPLWLLSSWFMYYTWFNGVYYFVILVFPVMHNALARVKGDLKAVNRWFIIYSAAALATGALLGLYYAFPSWKEHEDVHKAKSWKENAQNIYALSTMMFPPYWIPCVGTGMVGYFWFDAVRPAESTKLRCAPPLIRARASPASPASAANMSGVMRPSSLNA